MLASGAVDEFSVTTAQGAVYTLRYWGSATCALFADAASGSGDANDCEPACGAGDVCSAGRCRPSCMDNTQCEAGACNAPTLCLPPPGCSGGAVVDCAAVCYGFCE